MVKQREPLSDAELLEMRNYMSGFTRGGHYMGPMFTRLLDEHHAQRERVQELEQKLVEKNSRVECGWCCHEKVCRVPPLGNDWEEEPICLVCYNEVIKIDDIKSGPEWSKLKLWGAHEDLVPEVPHGG